jgi:chromosome segregation ATPase
MQELDAIKKDNFNLQLENHFLKERLSKMAPDHIEAALKENVKLKLEILNLSKESKKMKKLVMQQDRDLAAAQRNREDTAGDKGAAAEIKRRYEAELDEARAKMEDVEDALAKASDRADKAEDELERLQRGDVVPEQIEEVSQEGKSDGSITDV